MPDLFPLFGDADPDAPWQTTPGGVLFNAAGFDKRPRKPKRAVKRLNRALKWLRSQNVPESVLTEFSTYYNELPDLLPTRLDSAYTFIHDQRWVPCFGRYPKLAGIKPGDIRIQLVATPVYVPFYQTHAAALTDMNTGLISICVAAVSPANPPDPTLNWLRKVGDLARWEIGNWAGHWLLKLDPKVREVGDQALC